MKKIVVSAIVALLCTLVIAVIPTEAEGEIYSDTVRLDVIANSDSEGDQSLKLAVRDRILAEFSGALSSCGSAEEAEAALRSRLSDIQKCAGEVIREHGYEYPVAVTLSEEKYGRRDYGDFSLPAGRYMSLRIMIGEATGKNWWCVMFPPLCTTLAEGEATDGYTDEEVRLIGGKYRIKFKLLELAAECFS